MRYREVAGAVVVMRPGVVRIGGERLGIRSGRLVDVACRGVVT
jgi:hypothetical protein